MALNLRKPPKLNPKLTAYPYQLDAVKEICDFPYAAIFHEQGLGKTKIAIDLTLYWLESNIVDTVFIITKKSLTQNWINEFQVHSHIEPRILSDNRRENNYAFNAPVLAYVLNYEVIPSNLDLIKLFLKTCRVGVILDESQKIKNPESNLTKSFLEIASGFHRKIIMTGTPVANRPFDIWSQIKFLDGGNALGDSFSKFKNETDLPKSDAGKEKYSETLANIMKKIKSFSIRETKISSGLELPQKTIKTHYVKMQLKQQQIYDDYRNRLSHEFEVNGEIVKDDVESVLKRLLRLIQCASNPLLVDKTYKEVPGKFLKLQELLETADLQKSKVIIWSSFIENTNWLAQQLSVYNPERVHGDRSIEERNSAIERFKKDSSCKILIATPGAAKEGLTLTVANHAIFYDRSFNLDDYLQAQDRIHRISQTQECFIHNLIAENTLDEWVDRLLYVKYQAAQLVQGDVSEKQFTQRMDFNVFEALQQILGEKPTQRKDMDDE